MGGADDKHKGGSKGGGKYVGTFLQLFDWNAKSRKTLFPPKPDDLPPPPPPDRSKQGRKKYITPTSRLNLVDEDAAVGGPSSIRGGGSSCASSVTDDESYASKKPPGVVARLMGLDSLPTSNFSQPFLDSHSLRDSHYHSTNLDFHHISHSGNLINRVDVDDSIRSTSRPLKKPIDKFQTEVLPPKSTKSISITHHKLLSPIKNPGYNYNNKNAAHIMEAAAKIIEPGPPAISKTKMPHVGSSSSSVPFRVRELKQRAESAQKLSLEGSSLVQQQCRVRDLKEKTDTTQRQSRVAQKPFECNNAAMHLKGQSMNKSWDGPDTNSFTVLPDITQSSDGLMRNKGKSVSLAVQAKVNVQKREGINSSTAKRLGVQRERNGEVKSNHQFLPNSQKGAHKKSPAHRASGVLTQNNQKQNNCAADKNKLSSKTSVSASQGRKTVSGDSSFGRHNITTSSHVSGTSKAGSRKMGFGSTGDGNEILYSSVKNFPRKKRIIDGESIFEKKHAIDLGGFADKFSAKAKESSPSRDSCFDWVEDSRKKGMDVVSFTFTAPMTRSMSGSEPTNTDRMKLSSSSSSLGYNVIGSDALSILLEQKLREISIGVRSSRGDSIESDSTTSSSSVLQHFSPTTSDFTEQSNAHDQKNTKGLFIDTLRTQFDCDFSSNDDRLPKFQGVDEMDECSSSSINQAEAKHVFDPRNPSPVSILEPSFSTESSSDSNGKGNPSIKTREAVGPFKKFNSYETEILDSASSASIKPWTRKHVFNGEGSIKWDVEYMKEILYNVECMFNEYALGRANEIINPRLFYQLENRRSRYDSNDDSVSRSQRKVLFDCVGECVDMRCRTWAKGTAAVKKKERLAEDIYKEISSWEKMGDSMVDELVDKDMSSSSHNGKWADFEVESFEIGVEIDAQIFTCLVNDLVADILPR